MLTSQEKENRRKEMIKTLQNNDFQIKKSAQKLGISRNSFYKRLNSLELKIISKKEVIYTGSN